MASRILLAGTFVAVIYLFKTVIRYIQVERIKSQHGCKPVTRLPQNDRPIGYGLLKIQLASVKEKRNLQLSWDRYKAFGNTWSACLLGQTFVNTIEPENIKTILTTNFKDYGLGGRLQSWGPLLGEGVFTTDGAQWEHSRALIRPNFARAQVANLDTFESHIQILFSKIPKDGATFDLQELFFKLTLDTATEFLFGASVHSLLSSEDSDAARFGVAFDLGQSRLGKRSRLGRLTLLFRDREFDEACRVAHEFVDGIVSAALEKEKVEDLEKSIDGEQPERYIFLTELLKATRDPKQIRDELLNILLAGRDTTASFLSNTFHVLARRPDIWKKLQSEIQTLNGQKPDYDTLRNLKYLKCVLNESLRLYPVVPGNARFAVRDTILPRGGGEDGAAPVFIHKGDVVAWHVWNVHRRTDIYGDDALEFRPERWGAEENLRPGWGYLPFNGGQRICVGQQFALTEASYTIVRLLQEFKDIEDKDGGSQWVERISLTVASDRGVPVAMIPR